MGWKKRSVQTKNAGKTLFAAVKEECFKFAQSECEKVSSLTSSQEEADIHTLLHASHAVAAGYKSITIVSDDTDVLILCLAMHNKLSSQLLMKTGTQSQKNYADISKLAMALGPQVCKALL